MNKPFFQPLKPFHIHQRFGENNACIDNDLNVITCDGNNPPAGYRSLYGTKGHLGVDLRAYHGQEVYCIQGGKVIGVDTDPKSGLDVKIQTTIEGATYKHTYEHLLGYQHKIGDSVDTGQLVGWADNTGYSSGDHLHLQVEQLINGEWTPIDPMPLMEPVFAKDILAIKSSLKWVAEQVALLMDRWADRLRS